MDQPIHTADQQKIATAGQNGGNKFSSNPQIRNLLNRNKKEWKYFISTPALCHKLVSCAGKRISFTKLRIYYRNDACINSNYIFSIKSAKSLEKNVGKRVINTLKARAIFYTNLHF